MVNKKNPVASFDEQIQANRKDRNAKLAQEMLGKDPKKLAQDMLGKQRRNPTPKGAVPASLASRLGVNKRSNSIPRPNTAPPRNPRQAPTQSNRPKLATTASSGQIGSVRNNGRNAPKVASEISILGAAGGPYIVRAQNFAPGTTAADIESVMTNVGGSLAYCKLVASTPTVIAEVEFFDKAGADNVIDTFNNKKADGRVLYVYYERDGGAIQKQQAPIEPDVAPVEDAMMMDENTDERVAQDKLREERRGRDGRGHREEFPAGPRYDQRYQDNYNREFQGQDQRYNNYSGGRGGGGGFGGGRGGGGYRGNGAGRMRGGQSYRP